MRIKQLVFGLATWVPGFFSILARPTGGSSSVRYCYSVWLRHLVFARKHGLPRLPRVIAELGPGDSLGVGLAALVSGAEKYYALDVFRYANEAHLNSMIDELATLFLARTPIPGEDEFPRLYPKLETYDFPSWLFDDVHLHDALAPERIAYLHETLSNSQRRQQIIEYAVPWYAHDVVQKGEIDFIWSQAVLEYVDELEQAYAAMYGWLKDGGVVSHQIDYSAHQTSKHWDGHRTYGDFIWWLMRGRQPYWLNRQTHSQHLELLAKTGHSVLVERTVKQVPTVERSGLSPRFADMSDDDMETRCAYILAQKEPVAV